MSDLETVKQLGTGTMDASQSSLFNSVWSLNMISLVWTLLSKDKLPMFRLKTPKMHVTRESQVKAVLLFYDFASEDMQCHFYPNLASWVEIITSPSNG